MVEMVQFRTGNCVYTSYGSHRPVSDRHESYLNCFASDHRKKGIIVRTQPLDFNKKLERFVDEY